MDGPPVSPSPIRASKRPVTKATKRKATKRKTTERKTTKRKTTKRKATPENERPQKRQRVGDGPDTSTDSAQSTLESVIVINSSSDESTVSSGDTSTVRFSLPHSSSHTLASRRPVTKAPRRKATKRKATKRKTTKRKATPEHERPVKRQRVGEGPDTSTDSAQSTLESVIVINSSSDEST
ncbi:unnamed protein product, partial [Pleuronectes platessa]